MRKRKKLAPAQKEVKYRTICMCPIDSPHADPGDPYACVNCHQYLLDDPNNYDLPDYSNPYVSGWASRLAMNQCEICGLTAPRLVMTYGSFFKPTCNLFHIMEY